MATGPSLGPASAYPTLSRPASICFSDANDVLVPGLIARMPANLVLLGCASAEPFKRSWAVATVTTAVPRKLRVDLFGFLDRVHRRISSRSAREEGNTAEE